MKLLVCSDLHTNFHKDWGKSLIKELADADVAVIAGDLSAGKFVLEQNIRQLCDKYNHVVYVTGNHEYYGSSFGEIDSLIGDLESELDNFWWLNDKYVDINGVNFIGGTLWFPATQNAKRYKSFLNDYRCIGGFEPEVYVRYTNTVRFFTDKIQEGDIVVTHHMPSYQCVNPKYVGSKVNCYFANDLDDLIADTKPAMWIHGHGHDLQKCTIGKTRVIGNPMGYPGENHMFDEGFIVEV